jgi:DNA-binding transcriptional ArsR family regulator
METTAIESSLQIDSLQLKKAALILRAINHPLRQQMLQLIHQNKQITVTSIYEKLRLEQSVASQHLALLRTAGFVNTARDARFIYYSVNYDRIEQLHTIAAELIS